MAATEAVWLFYLRKGPGWNDHIYMQRAETVWFFHTMHADVEIVATVAATPKEAMEMRETLGDLIFRLGILLER